LAVNVEIKARVNDLSKLRGLIEELSDTPGEAIMQEDTFFHTPTGRLKLRILAPDSGELIYYERENVSGPKPSNYLISTSTHPDALRAVLSGALGIRGIVRKHRRLYRTGNTRIHVDEVEGLRSFLELEIVLNPGQTVEAGQIVAQEFMRKLGIEKANLVAEAYIDLLERRAT
jgi:predicted adenylyl cyclase CyaB